MHTVESSALSHKNGSSKRASSRFLTLSARSFALRFFLLSLPLFALSLQLRAQTQTELGVADDLSVFGTDGNAADPDVEIKGFTVFGSTQALGYTGAVVGPGNVVVNGALAVSSGAYFTAVSTFNTGMYVMAGIHLNDAAPSATAATLYNSGGNLYWNGTSLTGGGALPLASEGYTLRGNGSSWQATNNLFVKSDGNVGIGTTGPLAMLDVRGLGTTSSTFGFGVANGVPAYTLVVRDDGNVGIGTTAPATALQVAGATGVTIGEDKAGGTVNTAGTIKLISSGDNAFYNTFTSGANTANATYTLPAAMPAGNAILQSSSGGVLTWTSSYLASYTETDPIVKGIIGIVKSNGTLISAAAGSDLNATFGSKTANYVYAAPNGSSGTPDFRAIVAADIPALNQNTSGTANVAGGTLGAIPYQSGANATTVLAATATGNKILLSGANAAPVWSTPTFPNASATSGKVIKSDGANWTASGETYAAPGASGNLLVSDGTNWTSSLPTFNQNTTGSAGTVTNGVYTNAANSFTLINPLTTIAESWIGPNSTAGIYFKGGNVGIGTTAPGAPLEVSGTSNRNQPLMVVSSIGSFNGDGSDTTEKGLSVAASAVAVHGLLFDVKIGSQYLFNVGGNGNVGIGTASPGFPLHVVRYAGSSGTLRLEGNDTVVGMPGIGFYNNNGGASASINWDGAKFSLSTTTYINGNVGIGTTAPGAKLDVKETTNDWAGIGIQALTGTKWYVNAGISGVNNGEFAIGTNANGTTPALAILNSGNVGIGTTAPNTRVDIAGMSTILTTNFVGSTFSEYIEPNISATAVGSSIGLRANGTGGDFSLGAISQQPASVGWRGLTTITYMSDTVAADQGFSINQFHPNNAQTYERFRIDSAGNVGIGTTGPAYLLDVQGTGSTTMRIQSNTSSLNYLDIFNTNTGTTSNGSIIRLITENSSGTGNAVIDMVKYASGGFYINNSETTTGAGIGFSVAGTERMHINSSGNVGIGTAAPGQTLHVVAPTGSPATTGTVQNGILRIGGSSGGNGLDIGVLAGSPYSTWMQSGYLYDYGIAAYYPISLNPLGGNVGIGTNVPMNKLEVYGDGVRNVAQASTSAGESEVEAQVFNYWPGSGTGSPTYTGTALQQFGSSGAGTTAGIANANLGVLRFQNGSTGLIYTNGGSPIVFATANAERMRVAPGGNVGIGTGGPSALLHVAGTARVNQLIIGETANTSNGSIEVTYNDEGNYGIYFYDTNTGLQNAPALSFNRNSTNVGSINLTNTSTAYATGSDRRLKENFSASAAGLKQLMQIPVRDFNFISDPDKKRVQGFIAQELYKSYPEAVTVGGDDPKIKPWLVDYGRLTPLLVKTAQEQQEQLNDLAKALDNLRREFKEYKKAHP